MHNPIGYLAHKIWRIVFFPLAILIAGGVKGPVTFVSFAILVIGLSYVKLPRS
jgi:hypothetical protein